MTVQYQITSFHEATGSIMVKFHDEVLPHGIIFSLNLPVQQGSYPKGDALDAFIRQHAPHELFEKARNSARRPNGGHIVAMIDPSAATPMAGVAEDQAPYCIRDGQLILQPRPLSRANALDTPAEIL